MMENKLNFVMSMELANLSGEDTIRIKLDPRDDDMYCIGLYDTLNENEYWLNISDAKVLVEMLEKSIDMVEKYRDDNDIK